MKLKNISLAFGFVLALSSSKAAISYPNFSSPAGLDLNGSTIIANNGIQDVLRLTWNYGQGGSAFSTSPVTLSGASFSTFFKFQISDPAGISDADGRGADGLVFVVQTVSSSVGGTGGGIGFAGIPNSVGVEFDTYNNGGVDAFNGNHIGIDLNGSVGSVALAPEPKRFNDGDIWNAWVDYDGDTDQLEVRYSLGGRPLFPNLAYNVDLESVLGVPDAFVGFTSGTGSATGLHDILEWEFRADYDPIEGSGVAPEVQTYATGFGALLIVGHALRRRLQQVRR